VRSSSQPAFTLEEMKPAVLSDHFAAMEGVIGVSAVRVTAIFSRMNGHHDPWAAAL